MNLLTKDQYNQLAEKWKKHNVVYQKWDRYSLRFPTILKYIGVFKDKNVLEVGSNAGLAGFHIAQVAKAYFAVEGQEGYHRQALETKKAMKKNEHVNFMNMSVKTFMKRRERGDFRADVNAVFLSYVLYHFSDKEVRMFTQMVLPKVDTIIVMSRYAERNKKGRRKHNSYSFWHPDNVKKFLIKNGFLKLKVEWGPRKKFHFIIGMKDLAVTESVVKNGFYGLKPGYSSEQKPGEGVKGIQLASFDTEENVNEDTGPVAIHTADEGEAPKGRGTRSRQGRVAQRKPRSSTRRKINTEGSGEDVLPEERKNRSSGVLQSGVAKSSEAPVREKNVSEVGKTSSDRSSSGTGENNNS